MQREIFKLCECSGTTHYTHIISFVCAVYLFKKIVFGVDDEYDEMITMMFAFKRIDGFIQPCSVRALLRELMYLLFVDQILMLWIKCQIKWSE